VRGLRPLAALVSRLSGAEVLVSFRPGRDGLVALTFDDGPHALTTPGLLDVLAAHRAHATFFIIGERGHENPSLLGRIAAEGHEIGNHLMRDEPSIRLGGREFDRQLAEVDTLLRGYGPVRYFRPGSGWFSPRMLRSGARAGYRCALGSPDLVAQRYRDPAALAARLARRCRPGAIIVLHEGTSERAAVVEVTDRLLSALALKGLRAGTLAEVSASSGR
jgi:peptidoglycan/xylan/chitin deacetylase (PgdA/CDA1 family)